MTIHQCFAMKFRHDTGLIHTNPNHGQFSENVTPFRCAGYGPDLVGEYTCEPAWFGSLPHYMHGLAHVVTTCMVWYTLRHWRKRKVMQDDCNCLFKALAYIAYGTNNNHATMCQILRVVLCNNRPVLIKYITSKTFEQHIATVIRQGAWGNQVELFAAASYYRLPYMYVFSHHTQNQQLSMASLCAWASSQIFYWENCAAPQTNSTITHIELCHTAGNDFGRVLTLNNALSSSPPELDHTFSYVNIC